MKKISTWALYYPKQARLLMAFIKVVLFFLALYIGNLLSDLNVHFSKTSLYLVLLLFFTAVITYPDKRKKKACFEYSFYIRQKVNDFLVALSSFFILILAFNTNLFLKIQNPAYASAIVTNSNNVVAPSLNGKQKKLSAKEWRQLKAKFKKELKRIMLGKPDENGAGTNKGWKLALAISAGVVLTALLAALACAIACNGSEVLAVILLAVGLGGVIWGLIAWIKSIYKRRGVARRKKKKMEQVLAMNA